jgi:hypothetical protein
LDEVTKDQGFSLTILNFVTDVAVVVLEQVEDGKNLSVIRHESFTNSVGAHNQVLQNLQCHSNDLGASSV